MTRGLRVASTCSKQEQEPVGNEVCALLQARPLIAVADHAFDTITTEFIKPALVQGFLIFPAVIIRTVRQQEIEQGHASVP
jgi:hypothetical protein